LGWVSRCCRKKLVNIKHKEAQWLRDYRINREAKSYLWGGIDVSSNADRQQSLTSTTGLGWRRNDRELLELTLRNVQTRAFDQPLQTAYIDLIRADGNGVLDVMSNLTHSLQAAVSTNQVSKLSELSNSLTGNLNDKFEGIVANQKFPVSFGLGNLQDQLRSTHFTELKK